MAETTYKTKDKNTFRFKSFADRVNEIDLRRLALYHIGHQNEQLAEDEQETYFHQTLKKWIVLNLTEEFSVFSRKCTRIVTLPQLIHQKDVVIDALLERLATATNLSLQPLLELLYVLARDLREEFYPYFQRVLDRLICLLNTQDAEQLEWTFVCLAYLFKALKPYLKRSIGVVFHTILPLLDEQRYDEPVTNFAVECFSFIARDVRDYKKFLDFVLETVAREQIQSVQGCGRLLFEIIRGVKGQFHSTAGDFLHFMFNSLIDEQCANEEKLLLLGEIVENALQEILKFVHPQNMNVFWQKLCDVASSIDNVKKITFITPVFLKATSYRGGKHLAEMDVVVPTVLKMLDKCMRSAAREALQHLSSIVSKIVLSVSTQVTQLDISRLIKKMLGVEDRKIYDDFIISTVTHPQFELLILPAVIAYYENHFDLQALKLLANVVLEKRPLAVNAVELAQWKAYALHLKKPKTLEKILDKFSKINYHGNEETLLLDEYLLLCILAPHIKALDGKIIENDLKRFTGDVLNSLDQSCVEDNENKLQILCLLIETALHLEHEFSKDFLHKCMNVQLRFVNSYYALSCIDQLLTRDVKSFTEQQQQIFEAVAPLLSSSQHNLRLIAAHSLKTLHQTEALKSPYEAIFAAESIVPDLYNYREQLLHLQKLEPASELFKAFSNERFKIDVLRYLLGMLYQNFKLVWEPTLKLIEEYATILNVQDFWNIYKEKLETTALGIKNSYDENTKANVTEIEFKNIWSTEALNLALPQIQNETLNQHELFNYRNLLWQRLPKFGHLVELKNRELVTLFFHFIDNEYKSILEKREYTWDLLAMTDNKNKQNMVNDLEIDSEDSEDEDDDENITEKSESKPKNRRKPKPKPNSLVKSLLQTLQIKLGIFPVQPNPKALYREPELYALYMELLAGSNPILQKHALDCILAYKKKSLTTIKEHLYAIVDEQKFKDELIQFKLDVIPTEQRPEVMEIVLRLLYGKMLTKGTHRAMTAQVRKSLILRFLGQCGINEIFSFLQMAFGRFEQYTKSSIEMEAIPHLVQQSFDVKAVCSPRKLKAIVNLLELIRKEFGGIMNLEFHIYMLKLLIFVGSTCQAVLDATTNEQYQQQMHPKMPLVFRNAKNAALLSLVNFFTHLDTFEWQPSQLHCIIDVYVKPNIARLPQECIHTPTPLLKLLLQWGEQARFYDCLNHTVSTDERIIFHFMIELLLNERAKPPVRKPLMTVVENLLVTSSNTEDTEFSKISLTILTPFIPDILQRIKMNLGGHQQRKRHRRIKVSKQDINILSLLTTHVEDASTCDSLLQLLLPILIARTQESANEEVVVCKVITTLSNLIKRLDAPETYLQKIAPLFEFIQDVGARKMLCTLVVDIASKRLKDTKNGVEPAEGLCEHLKDTARLVLMLNAWDKRWVEQPDYDKRLDALKEVTKKLEVGEIELDLGVLVIYNCCYFLRYDKDMGLRDNAGEHLRLLLPKLTKSCIGDTQKLNFLINDIFINLVRRLIRDVKDNIRNEGIHLLGAMVRECPEAHAIFSDLHALGDKNDEEVDFFYNLTHLQSPRHGKALQKFCNHAGTLTIAPNTRTLTEFILPLATRYLLQEKYASKHTLVDAAIETIGVVCQLLPWQHYHTILRYYLNKMRHSHDYQKQCVRIVVRILDAFHFDLTQSKEETKAVLNEVKNVTIPKEETDEIDEDPEADLDTALEEATEEDTIVEKSSKLTISTDLLMKNLTPLSANASKRILTTITCSLIPTLNRTITEKSHYDNKHKVNRKRAGFEREEEEILRVPIALALVKLLQKLPKELLDNSLPGVFMKVCTFLRSPLKSVRMLTRDILKKIMLALGSSYLTLLVEHLQSLLTRGFQVHVLSVTIHGVLDALRGKFQPGDIDNCLGNLLEVALNDIFGDVAAEKEVQKIASHTPEAKPSAKSFLVLHIAARNIQEACLLDLLMPFKEHLARSHSRKLILKIQDCFAKIVSGLVENPHISRESLLVFIYGTISESITDLLPGTQKRALTEKEKENIRRARPDCYIIQPTPKRRMGAVNKNVKTNAQANAHILIEFGLEMLHIVLKRKKLKEFDYQAFLNPIFPLLRDSLKSTYIRVTTFTLKCLAALWNNEYEVPSLDEYLSDIVVRMFEILKNLSSFGASKQEDNLQLIKSTMKAMVALLRQCPQYTLSAEQIDQLVLHIEQDLFEGDKQLISFSLLKAMIARKVESPSVHNILKQIAEITVTSQSDYVRDESRNILLTYIMEYSLKKRVDQIIKNFSVQLCYTVPAGRLSAIQFMAAIIKRFPLSILSNRAEFLYLSLGTRLVNDDDSTCRKEVADCIESLISRLEKADRQRLFEITLLFFEESHKPSVREMAASLCSRFVNVEKRGFKARLQEILPILVVRLTLNNPRAPGKFVRAPATLGVEIDPEYVKLKQSALKKKGKLQPNLEEQDSEELIAETVLRKQRAIDHEIIQIQYCVHKILEQCIDEVFNGNDEVLLSNIDELAYASQRLLAHEHVWVRCNAAKTIAQILAQFDFELVGRKLCAPKMELNGSAESINFLYSDPASDIRSLVLDLCAQMIPDETSQEMIDEVAKIFLFVANMLRNVPFSAQKEEINNDEEETVKINLKWLFGRVRFLINREVTKAPHCVKMRTALFNLIEGLITIVNVETLKKLAPSLLLVLVREMSEDDQQIDMDLRQLALHVGSRLRKSIGADVYDKLRAQSQTTLLIRRAERKKIVAQEKIHDPLRAAKRKTSMQERKKAAKKRKNDVMRGRVEDTKQKLKKRKRKAESGDLF